MSLPPDTIRYYEELFFDVRPHLRHREWIARHVPGCDLRVPLGCKDVGPFWRRVGLTCGIMLLEPLLALRGRALNPKLGLKAYFQRSSCLPFELQIQLGQLCMPQLAVDGGRVRLMELARDTDWKRRLTPVERQLSLLGTVVSLVRSQVVSKARNRLL